MPRTSARRFRPVVETLEERTVPTLLGQQLFPADNPWNQAITNAPVAANSDAILANIIGKYGDGQLHPDFTQNYGSHDNLYGIPYNIVHGNSTPLVDVYIDSLPDESDIVPAPIPADAVLENDYQDEPRFDRWYRSDSHLIVWDVDNNVVYEFFHASRPNENADGKWHADQQTVWDLKTNTFRTLGWTSADAAGLPILPGLVRPDEVLEQGVINHAIRVTMENDIILERFVYPASHTANPDNLDFDAMPPMGARFRLKAGVDLSELNPQSRIIAQAMKDYGLIVADNGPNFFFSGASSAVDADNQLTLTWSDADIQDEEHGLKSLSFSDFEVVDLRPIVVGIDVHEGTAGTEVIVTGQNFSGAAGHLQVLFGSVPATSVTVLDDGHVRATAPVGHGTVDVRVQSGVLASYWSNLTNPVFGYGTSNSDPGARFTYPNFAPTVAAVAGAAPAVISGLTTTLNVLGADDGGEANLTYTWSVISMPANAPNPLLQLNNSNAAKSTLIGLLKAGSYRFRVVISDAEGLATASEVVVTAVPVFSHAFLEPMAARVKRGGNLKLTAYAYDQFGDLLAQQPKFTWKATGQGRVDAKGRYFAPRFRGGPFTITARAGTFKLTARVRVI